MKKSIMMNSCIDEMAKFISTYQKQQKQDQKKEKRLQSLAEDIVETVPEYEIYISELLFAADNIVNGALKLDMTDFKDIQKIYNGSYNKPVTAEQKGIVKQIKSDCNDLESIGSQIGLDIHKLLLYIAQDMEHEYGIAKPDETDEQLLEENIDECEETISSEGGTKDILLELLQKCKHDMDKEHIMKGVEHGLFSLKEAASELNEDIDNLYSEMINAGYKVPFYFSSEGTLIMDCNSSYITICSAFSMIKDAISKNNENNKNSDYRYSIELNGCNLLAGYYYRDGVKGKDFHIVSEYSPADMKVKYFLEDCESYEIAHHQKIFWKWLENILR